VCKIEHSIIGEKELAVSEFSYFLQENHMGAWSMINDMRLQTYHILLPSKELAAEGPNMECVRRILPATPSPPPRNRNTGVSGASHLSPNITCGHFESE
jgi:hypothetical protein